MTNNKKYIKRELIIPLSSDQWITESLLTEVINKLFANEIKEIFSIKDNSGYIASFFTLQRGNGSFISIGPMVALLPSTEAQAYANFIANNFFIKDNTYLDNNYLSINIKLIHRIGDAPITRQVIDSNIINNKKSDLTIFNNYRIPGFINPYDIGNVVHTVASGDVTIYTISIGGGRIIIAEQIVNKHGYISSNIKLIKDGSVVIKAKDVQTSPSMFTRSIKVGDVTKVWIYDILLNFIEERGIIS